MLSQVEGLGLSVANQPINEAPGDVHERIERTRQALSQRGRELETLRKGCEQVEADLIKGASQGFVETLDASGPSSAATVRSRASARVASCRCCVACSSCSRTSSSN